MKNLCTIILGLILTSLIAAPVLAESKFGACCSANKGVCGCENGGAICCDGVQSTCSCDPKDFQVHVPAPTATAAIAAAVLVPEEHAKFLPDSHLTPGDILTSDKQKICAKGYIQSVGRTAESVKDQVYALHKISKKPTYEIDHLISKGLGGSNEIKNLYPQTRDAVWNMAKKDQLENLLHRLVCEGKVNILTAQQEMRSDWISAFKKYVGEPKPKSKQSKPAEHIKFSKLGKKPKKK